MAKNYYVLDGEGNTVWQGKEKDDGPQSFATFAAAEKRAKAYADREPGTEVRVVKVEAVVIAAVLPPKTRRI